MFFTGPQSQALVVFSQPITGIACNYRVGMLSVACAGMRWDTVAGAHHVHVAAFKYMHVCDACKSKLCIEVSHALRGAAFASTERSGMTINRLALWIFISVILRCSLSCRARRADASAGFSRHIATCAMSLASLWTGP